MSRRTTTVTADGDHITIQTTPRKHSALLMVLAGATLEEAGQVLGVSRQRVQQYLKEAGLTSAVRSRPSRSSFDKYRKPRRDEYWRSRRATMRARRKENAARAVTYLRAYYEANGVVPTTRQLAEVLRGRKCRRHQAAPFLVALFGGHLLDRRAWRRIKAVYSMAGLAPRGPGSGTMSPKERAKAGARLTRWRKTHPKEVAAHIKKMLRARHPRVRTTG